MKKILFVFCFLISGFWGITQNSTKELSDNNNLPSVSGFYNRISVGVLGGSNSSPSFNVVNGYRFNEHFSTGFGLGFEHFFNRWYVPLFFEGNYKLLKNNTSPFLGLMSGYELPLRSIANDKGGFTCGGKIGFDFFVNKHVGITTSLGYRFGILRDFSNSNSWDNFVVIRQLNRYEFRVGVVFQ